MGDTVAEGGLRSKSTEAFCSNHDLTRIFCKTPQSMTASSPSATVSEVHLKKCRVQRSLLQKLALEEI